MGLVLASVPAAPVMAEPGDTALVYVSYAGSDKLAVFRAGPDGNLALAGTVATGDEPRGLVFGADGRRAYVVNANHAVADQEGSVLAYTVDAGGGLSPYGQRQPARDPR